jgi:hypothetical protein
VLSILGGIIAGVIGFLPFVGGLQISKRTPSAATSKHVIILLLALFISCLFLFVISYTVISLNRSNALPFVLSEALALSCVAVVYSAKKIIR